MCYRCTGHCLKDRPRRNVGKEKVGEVEQCAEPSGPQTDESGRTCRDGSSQSASGAKGKTDGQVA